VHASRELCKKQTWEKTQHVAATLSLQVQEKLQLTAAEQEARKREVSNKLAKLACGTLPVQRLF